MNLTGKYAKRQMDLLEAEEWLQYNSTVHGIDVFDARTGRVREKWISDCAKERVLTSDLLLKVCSQSNLEKACRHVISNKGSSGIDGMTTDELKVWFQNNHIELQGSLLSGRYIPQPVLEVEIPKASGGVRKLGIPTVIDCLVQQAIHQVLSPRYEKIFSENSFGFRPNGSAHKALHVSSELVRQGNSWLVDIDLEKYFDTVNHQRLMWLLSRRIGDKLLLKLIHRILKTGILVDGLVSQRVKGTPQGGPLSPLLSNIVLDELDKELERRGHNFVRYADDLRIFLKSEMSANRVMNSVTEYLEKRLKLKVNRRKSRVLQCFETNFLGHSILFDGTLCLSKESEKRFYTTVREITKRKRGISLETLIKEVNIKIRGWLHYFRFASMKRRLTKMFSWLKHRLRCFRLKQCKKPIGIVRFLRKLSVPEWRCWIFALSGKGWWRLSSAPQAHEAMSNKWFCHMGLFDLLENYKRLKLEETAVYQQVCTVV